MLFRWNWVLFKNAATLPYPRGVEFSGEEVIVLPLASIASLFVVELKSRLPLNGCNCDSEPFKIYFAANISSSLSG